jgi:hypothetical protein
VGIGIVAPAAKLHVQGGDASPAVAYIDQNVATNHPTMSLGQGVHGGNGNNDIGLVVQMRGVADATNHTDRILNLKSAYATADSSHSRFMVLRDGRTIIGDNIAATSVAANSRFEVHGTSGQLFQVSDDLDDVVFSANNISGLPVIEAKADNTVKLGKFGRNDLVVASNGHIGIGMDSPSYPFELKRSDAINTYLSTENTTVANAGVRMKNSQGEWIIIANDKLRFYDGDNSIERMAIHSDGTVVPGADNTQDLGSSSLRWANLHVADMQLSNVNTGGNEVDGTEGSWSVQEGEDDIYLINRKNGKRFKIKLEEV